MTGNPISFLARPGIFFPVVLVIGLSMISLLPPVTAFRAIDQGMCKGIDWNTLTCPHRDSEFLPIEPWGYFWFKATFERSDEGAKIQFNLYEPQGSAFGSSPEFSLKGDPTIGLPPYEPGDMFVWLGVGVGEARWEGGFATAYADASKIEASVRELRETKTAALWPIAFYDTPMASWKATGVYVSFVGPQVNYVVWMNMNRQASQKAGDWRVEFTLNEKVVVSERFRILGKTGTTVVTSTSATTPIAVGTETQSAVELPSNLLTIGSGAAVATIVILVAGYVHVQRKKRLGARER